MIGVIGAVPIALEGLRTALHEHSIVAYESTGAPAFDESLLGLVVWVGGRGDIDALRSLAGARERMPTIAVLTDVAFGHDALQAGASSMVYAGAPVDTFVNVIQSCLTGSPVIPAELVVRAMDGDTGAGRPSAVEKALLDGLSRRDGIRRIASDLGYSERHVHRLLRTLHSRLGTDTRDAALDAARRRGWLAD